MTAHLTGGIGTIVSAHCIYNIQLAHIKCQMFQMLFRLHSDMQCLSESASDIRPRQQKRLPSSCRDCVQAAHAVEVYRWERGELVMALLAIAVATKPDKQQYLKHVHPLYCMQAAHVEKGVQMGEGCIAHGAAGNCGGYQSG